MTRKNWKSCDKCGVQTRNIRVLKGSFFCFNCFQKTFVRIQDGGGDIFEKKVIKKHGTCINLTEEQDKLLLERLSFLYPQFKDNENKNGLSDYLRCLIISDLKRLEEE